METQLPMAARKHQYHMYMKPRPAAINCNESDAQNLKVTIPSEGTNTNLQSASLDENALVQVMLPKLCSLIQDLRLENSEFKTTHGVCIHQPTNS